MKHLKLSTAIISSACLLFFSACNDSTGNKTTKSDAKTSASSSNTAASYTNLTGSKENFSYTINGERVETAADVQNGGLFINEVSNDAANGMLKIEVTTKSSNVFVFKVANNGTTSIGKYQPSLSGFMDKKTKEASYMDGKINNNFYSDSVTVTITNISSSRVSGTFSGTFTQDKSYGNKTVTITDGSFNLPFIKS